MVDVSENNSTKIQVHEFSTSSDMVIYMWSVLSITSLAQSLHKPPSLRHAPFTTDKGVLPQRLPPSSFFNLHCCRRPICWSTLLQFHLVPFVHLLLNVLQVYSICTQNFIGIVGPKVFSSSRHSLTRHKDSISSCAYCACAVTCKRILLFVCVRSAYRKELYS